MSFYVGLDLGQSNDFTALAAVEEVKQAKGFASGSETNDTHLHLRYLERHPLRTPYPEIANGVARLMSAPGLRRAKLFVDGTGVGVAVTDLLRERGLRFTSVTITGGEKVTGGGRSYGVPKKDLVGALEVPFHNGTLKVAEGLALWPTLREEMLNFRRKIALGTGHASYEHWRESDHDDLVLAAALACWGATKRTRLATVYSF